MKTCPKCGAANVEEAVLCTRCMADLNAVYTPRNSSEGGRRRTAGLILIASAVTVLLIVAVYGIQSHSRNIEAQKADARGKATVVASVSTPSRARSSASAPLTTYVQAPTPQTCAPQPANLQTTPDAVTPRGATVDTAQPVSTPVSAQPSQPMTTNAVDSRQDSATRDAENSQKLSIAWMESVNQMDELLSVARSAEFPIFTQHMLDLRREIDIDVRQGEYKAVRKNAVLILEDLVTSFSDRARRLRREAPDCFSADEGRRFVQLAAKAEECTDKATRLISVLQRLPTSVSH